MKDNAEWQQQSGKIRSKHNTVNSIAQHEPFIGENMKTGYCKQIQMMTYSTGANSALVLPLCNWGKQKFTGIFELTMHSLRSKLEEIISVLLLDPEVVPNFTLEIESWQKRFGSWFWGLISEISFKFLQVDFHCLPKGIKINGYLEGRKSVSNCIIWIENGV